MSCNPNPLDPCTRSFMQCDNPCKPEPGTCPELLPTQIDTFTTQFFGTVGKSNQGGSVAWSLPCGLDTGIASNPRLPGESVACYFLRLFEAGLTGQTGQQGAQGEAGLPGADAYSFTLQDFEQPTVQAPYINIALNPSASLVQGLFYEIENSGWYQLQNVNPDGSALLTLVTPAPNPPSIIMQGALVVASGMPGIRVQGPQGDIGDIGDKGITGLKGIPGIKGPQGDQGPSSATPGFNQFPTNPFTYGPMPNSFTDWNTGAGFGPFIKTSTPGTYFVKFALNVFVGQRFSAGAVTGYIKSKIKKYVNGFYTGDIPGSERDLTLNGETVTGAKNAIQPIQFIDSVTAGQTVEYVPSTESNIGGNYGGYITAAASTVSWVKLA